MPLFGGPPNVVKLRNQHNIRGLSKALDYQKDAGIREEAARALGVTRNKKAVAPLMEALMDREVKVRIAAAQALGHIGDARARGPLVALLREEQSEVRQAAMWALTKCDLTSAAPEGAVPLLLGILTDKHEVEIPDDVSVLGNAVVLLEKIDPARSWTRMQESKRAIPSLLIVLERFRVKADFDALEILFNIGQTDTTPFITLLTDKKQYVRETVMQILDEIDPNWPLSGTARRSIPTFISALQVQDILLLKGVIAVLRKIDPSLNWTTSEAARVAITTLVAALRNTGIDWLYTREAFTNLGKIAVEPLIGALMDKSLDSSTRRSSVAITLGEIGDARAVEPLIACLRDQSEVMRGSAAEALGEFGDARAVEALIAVLQSKVGPKQAAVAALGQIGDPSSTEPLITYLTDSPSGWSRQKEAAIEALGQIGDSRAVKPLVSLLKSERTLGDARRGEKNIAALLKIFEKNANKADQDDLQTIVAFHGKIVFASPISYMDGEGYGGVKDIVCRQLCQLARQELMRRGLRYTQ